MEKNYEKQERYSILIGKLKKAISNQFWFEACMIEYAIIEDRTSSILQYSKVCKDAYDSKHMLANKLRSIETQIVKKHPIISKKVDINTIREIRTWKDERNNLVHKACLSYNEEIARDLALKGNDLVKRINNDSAKVTRLAVKLEETK